MKLFLLLAVSTLFLKVNAQNNSTPCSAAEIKQFDFWVGDWNLTYNDTLHASNHVERILGGCTVQENFNDPNINYTGKSWTVFNPNIKKWQQTWVDSQGGYISLTGEKTGDSIVLTTEEKLVPASVSPTGKIISRMVYENIQPQSFDWNWESSTDGGITWKTNWHIHYQRKTT